LCGRCLVKDIVELELSAQYHQPAGVEQFGLEAIPLELKTVRWYDLFVIVVNFLINPATILIAGMAVASGLSFWAAVAAQTAGCLIAFAAYIVIATIGVDYGLPGQVATRMTFGIRGAKWIPSFLRVIASTYWFAFQTIASSLVIVEVLDRLFGRHHSLIIISVIFGLGQIVVAVWGYGSLKILSRVAFPIKILLLGFLWTELVRVGGPDFRLRHVVQYHGAVGWYWPVFVVWCNSMAAGWIVMITDAADFCRYSRSRMDMWIGTGLAALSGCFLGTFVGAYGAAATYGKVPGFFVLAVDRSASQWTLLGVFVVIVLDNWTINVLNLYTGGLSLSNIFENIGRFWTTLAVGLASVVLSGFPAVVSGYLQYNVALGNLFAPLAGILLADYLFVRLRRVQVTALFLRDGPYWYWKGFNLVAMFWTLTGFWIYFAIPAVWMQTPTTVLLVGAGYLLSMHLLIPRVRFLRAP
jgi:nucleobase:cation symporter-1, NCS1 family